MLIVPLDFLRREGLNLKFSYRFFLAAKITNHLNMLNVYIKFLNCEKNLLLFYLRE